MNTVRIIPEQVDTAPDGAFADFIDLASVLDFLKSYSAAILVSVILGILVAALYGATSQTLYSARTQIIIEPKIHQLQQAVSDINLSLDTPQIESQIAMLKSEKIASMVVEQLRLTENEAFLRSGETSLLARFRRAVSFVSGANSPAVLEAPDAATDDPVTPPDAVSSDPNSNAEPAVAVDPATGETRVSPDYARYRSAIELLSRRLTVRREGVSYAIEISFNAHSPELAADVANAVANSYVREQIENKSRGAKEGSRWLEARLQELRNQMNLATQAAQAFRAKHDYSIGVDPDKVDDIPGEDLLPGKDISSILQDRLKGPTLEELEVTADTYRKIYESVLQAYMSSVSQQSYPSADARIITPASPAIEPSHPRMKLLLAFGAFAGMMVGIAVAFGRQMLDDRVRTPQQLWNEIGLNCLGELPRPPRQWPGRPRFDTVTRFPKSEYVRALMALGTTLRLMEGSAPIRCIGITSGDAEARKGEFACHLAAMYERKGIRTLVMNADPSNSALTLDLPTTFAAKPTPADKRKNSKVSGQIRAVAGQSFDFLPGGTALYKQLNDADHYAAAAEQLQNYKMIVVELPPVSPGMDAFPLEQMLDGVVLYAEYGKSRMAILADALNTLAAIGTPVMGCVVADVRVRSRRAYNRMPVPAAQQLR
ncbi:GumC family protein [Oricola thermophila]|uniref:ATPase n=1 Tax=Oricola thermophila TaxID=2742145 RepID=A0A6N1VAH8_9HYPH|nr:Wzz/FepE/Etk N-terminal domain-containing protein [Oricola thermophila]QKV17940.1 ATPase [Oricola thermophila]